MLSPPLNFLFTYLGELVYDRTRIFIVEKQVLEKLTTELFLNQHVYTVIRLYGIKNGLCDNIDMLLPVVTIIFS